LANDDETVGGGGGCQADAQSFQKVRQIRVKGEGKGEDWTFRGKRKRIIACSSQSKTLWWQRWRYRGGKGVWKRDATWTVGCWVKGGAHHMGPE